MSEKGLRTRRVAELVRAELSRLLITEFQDLFRIDPLSDEETGNYQTLAGFTINHMGRIPSAGQFFFWRDFRIEVVDMDGNRVDKLLISKQTPPAKK